MKLRHRYRLQVEELEQRAVPAGLTGHHAIHTTLTAMFTPPATINGTFGSGLLRGTVSLSGTIVGVGPPTATAIGILTIHTKQGSVTTQDTLSVPTMSNGTIPPTGTFMDIAVITGGTGKFKGVTGNLTLNGTYSVPTLSASATVTGTISGPSHHHHHK